MSSCFLDGNYQEDEDGPSSSSIVNLMSCPSTSSLTSSFPRKTGGHSNAEDTASDDLSTCLETWYKNAVALTESEEMSELTKSTLSLVNAFGESVGHTLISPIVVPFHLACSAVDNLTEGILFLSTTTLDMLLAQFDQPAAISTNERRQVATKVDYIEMIESNENWVFLPNSTTPDSPTVVNEVTFLEEEEKEDEKNLKKPSVESLLTMNLNVHDLRYFTSAVADYTTCITSDCLFPQETLPSLINALTKQALEIALTSDKNSKSMETKYSWTHFVRWNAEVNFADVMKRRKRNRFSKECIFVWSAKFLPALEANQSATNDGNTSIPMFKGHGYINTNPESLFHLLLDNENVKIYNKYVEYRKDVHIFQDETDGSCITKLTKIVQTSNKLPIFALPPIRYNLLLHAERVQSEEAPPFFVIVSRSMEVEVSNKKLDSNSNIVWGINILRAVKGEPNVTELITVNQVQSNMPTKFLNTTKIGVRGVVDFFSNLQKHFK